MPPVTERHRTPGDTVSPATKGGKVLVMWVALMSVSFKSAVVPGRALGGSRGMSIARLLHVQSKLIGLASAPLVGMSLGLCDLLSMRAQGGELDRDDDH